MKRSLLITLILLSIAGLMLHYRIHPFMVPDKLNPGNLIFEGTKFLATFLSLIDVIFVTLLFCFRKTAVYGHLFNGLLVIYGSILMAHYSIAQFIAKPIPFDQMILKSTLPHIGIAWADFLVGKSLYDIYIKGH